GRGCHLEGGQARSFPYGTVTRPLYTPANVGNRRDCRALRPAEGGDPRRGPAGQRCDACAGAPLGAGSGRAPLAGLRGAADRREGRAAEGIPAPVHALVRRAGVRRSAGVQRRRPEADRRPRRAHPAPRTAEMRIAVCAPQVPFVRGGAELMAEDLVAALRARDYEAELVTMPFKWYPETRVLDQAFLWRLVDLTESDGRPIDRV